MSGDWRIWRPVIWLTMLGIAVMLVLQPWYFGAVFFGAAIGSGIRIYQQRRRASIAASKGPAPGRRRSRGR